MTEGTGTCHTQSEPLITAARFDCSRNGRCMSSEVHKAALFALNLILFLRQMFPYWELFIPTVGTKHSQPGNKTFPPGEIPMKV